MSSHGMNPVKIRKLRKKVQERDGNKCFYCEVPLYTYDQTLDHIIPVSQGGSNRLSNLVLACFACNNGRGTTPADQWMDYVQARKSQFQRHTLDRRTVKREKPSSE